MGSTCDTAKIYQGMIKSLIYAEFEIPACLEKMFPSKIMEEIITIKLLDAEAIPTFCEP